MRMSLSPNHKRKSAAASFLSQPHGERRPHRRMASAATMAVTTAAMTLATAMTTLTNALRRKRMQMIRPMMTRMSPKRNSSCLLDVSSTIWIVCVSTKMICASLPSCATSMAFPPSGFLPRHLNCPLHLLTPRHFDLLPSSFFVNPKD